MLAPGTLLVLAIACLQVSSAAMLDSWLGLNSVEEADTDGFSPRVGTRSEIITINIKYCIFWFFVKLVIIAFLYLRPKEEKHYYEPHYEQPSYHSGYHPRSFEGNDVSWFSSNDLTASVCFAKFMAGQNKLSCLKRFACEDPDQALEYVEAAKFIRQAHSLISFIPYEDKYDVAMEAMSEAADNARSGGDCWRYQW